jgi:hypothetical protein
MGKKARAEGEGEMTKLAWIAMMPLLLGFAGASAADVNLSKGQLTHDGSYSTQIVAAKNDTGDTLQEIWIECGFFRRGALVGAGTGYAKNVHPGQTAYVEVLSNHTEGSDTADCRVQSIE